ncbi:MAG TPA: ParB N-terminal domain-containing protein [Bacillota bacterium]|nr:ParB N-terminal domain-containing protein [Bacillota bacterium]HOL12640.1 ParB N-terminal domain-containing protein [Bacillota bacterium]
MLLNADIGGHQKVCSYSFVLAHEKDLLAHEQVDHGRVTELIAEITKDGVLKYPIIADKNSMVILDGHHRVRALTTLGCLFIPTYLVDYCDDNIIVTTWGDASEASRSGRKKLVEREPLGEVTKDVVVMAALTGRLLPPKTSRHVWPWPYEERPVPINILKGLTSSITC